MTRPHTRLAAAIAALGAFAAAAPALGQTTVEEITVTGRYGPVPADARSLSQVVSYSDLDLSTQAGRRLLHQRISLTARYLCDKLGESDTGNSVAPSCRDAAAKDAMARAGTLEASAAPRGTAWVAPAPWVAPYPTTWVATYPYTGE